MSELTNLLRGTLIFFFFQSLFSGGSDFKSNGGDKCEESSAPVKCGDGSCQPDYISCLKILSLKELKKKRKLQMNTHEIISKKRLEDVGEIFNIFFFIVEKFALN